MTDEARRQIAGHLSAIEFILENMLAQGFLREPSPVAAAERYRDRALELARRWTPPDGQPASEEDHAVAAETERAIADLMRKTIRRVREVAG